jgi:hypothetical protein
MLSLRDEGVRSVVCCLVAVALAAAACKRHTGVPAAESLYGTYTLTQHSLDLASALGFDKTAPQDHRIVLAADGRCEFFSYWYFARRVEDRRNDYYPAGSNCSWKTLDAEVTASYRANVVGAIDLSIWDRTVPIHRAAGVDLQVELFDGEPFLLATSGHPDDNGHRFLYQRVAR